MCFRGRRPRTPEEWTRLTKGCEWVGVSACVHRSVCKCASAFVCVQVCAQACVWVGVYECMLVCACVSACVSVCW